jgi:hypothetical protein
MSKKPKQAKKTTKSSKRTKLAAKPEDETDTAINSITAEAPQATPATPENEVAVESQLAEAVPDAASSTVAAPESEAEPKVIRSETAKANIKQGLKQHALAGRPTKAQLILVFGIKGYAMTWPQRTEKFGITPETFQAALAKGVPAVPLTPVAKPTVAETNGTV